MRLRDLPCFSSLFLDLVDSSPELAPFVRRLPDLDSVVAAGREARSHDLPRKRVSQVLERRRADFQYGEAAASNIRRLAQPDSVVVLVSCSDSFAGGALSQFLKCLTAAKLAAELERSGIGAVPVCWIEPREAPYADCTYLLDSAGELHSLKPELRAWDTLVRSRTPAAGLASRLFGSSVDQETLEFLRQCYGPDSDTTVATGRFLAGLMQEWGVVILDGRDQELHALAHHVTGLDSVDPGELSSLLGHQEALLRASKYGRMGKGGEGNTPPRLPSLASLLLESIFPAAARVVDQREVRDMAVLPALLSRLGLQQPRLWPQASVTILDTRSKRIMERYGIKLLELFQGPDAVMRRLPHEGMAEAGRQSMDQLTSRIEEILSELYGLVPAGDPLAAQVEDARKRMKYQVAKIRDLLVQASRSRREVMNRQITRVCNRLAPLGCPQELLLAGLNFTVRYSPVVLRILFRELEIRSAEHQLIYVE